MYVTIRRRCFRPGWFLLALSLQTLNIANSILLVQGQVVKLVLKRITLEIHYAKVNGFYKLPRACKTFWPRNFTIFSTIFHLCNAHTKYHVRQNKKVFKKMVKFRDPKISRARGNCLPRLMLSKSM